MTTSPTMPPEVHETPAAELPGAVNSDTPQEQKENTMKAPAPHSDERNDGETTKAVSPPSARSHNMFEDISPITANEPERPQQSGKDPFDFSALKLPQNFAEQAGVRKMLTAVEVKRPHKQTFIRVHPDEAYRRDVGLIYLEEDGLYYAVAAKLVGELRDLLVPVSLFTGETRQGTPFLWPIPLPGPDGRSHGSWDSQRMAAERAMHHWLRLQWNKEASAYDVFIAPNLSEQPAWPEMSFNELLKLAFKDRLIDGADHLVIRKLRGLA